MVRPRVLNLARVVSDGIDFSFTVRFPNAFVTILVSILLL